MCLYCHVCTQTFPVFKCLLMMFAVALQMEGKVFLDFVYLCISFSFFFVFYWKKICFKELWYPFPTNVLKWGKYPVKISRTSELNTSFVMLVCDDEATSSFHTQFPSVSPWQTEAKDNQALENKQSLGLRHHCHLFQVFRTHLYQQALISCFYFDSYFVYSVFVMFLLTHPVFFFWLISREINVYLTGWLVCCE